ncbi:MAG TPA: 3-isopropylmalate dehydrogenase [Thermodesulfobacteriota bacterium]|nr:3-isopropylmalate dehydrogenase [Thermodesulfobacteriota bacterium]
MKRFKVAVLPGDGIGPEIIKEALKVLKVLGKRFNIHWTLEEAPVGGASIDEHGKPLTDEVLDQVMRSDAVLLGAVGGPKWEGLDYSKRPERALLALRKELALFANLRPVKIYKPLIDASTLKKEVVDGVDIMVVRELTGGIYFGEPRGVEKLPDGTSRGVNTMVYTTPEIERIAIVAFEVAKPRRKKVTSVDKANVLETTELWRKVVTEVGADYPDIELNHMYVDNAAMQLIRNPKQFDVIVTGNMFGDILSDEAAMLTGSIGMLPSASLGPTRNRAMYEPIHGSAPDIAGKDMANPIATVLSAAMIMRFSFNMEEAATAIEEAVEKVLNRGLRTPDIHQPGTEKVTCSEMGSAIAEVLKVRKEGEKGEEIAVEAEGEEGVEKKVKLKPKKDLL